MENTDAGSTLQEVISFDDFQGLADEERKQLLTGPSILLCHRGNKIATVPQRLLMAVSPYANEMFNSGRFTTVFVFPQAGASEQAILIFVQYLVNVCNGKFFRIPWKKNVYQTAQLYQVGHALQMDDWVNHIRAHLVKQIETEYGLISYEDLGHILQRTNNDPTDPLFSQYARVLSAMRRKNAIPDTEDFDKWLGAHTALSELMDKYEAEYQAAQAAREKARDKFVRDRKPLHQARVAAPPAHIFGPGVHQIDAETARKMGRHGFAA